MFPLLSLFLSTSSWVRVLPASSPSHSPCFTNFCFVHTFHLIVWTNGKERYFAPRSLTELVPRGCENEKRWNFDGVYIFCLFMFVLHSVPPCVGSTYLPSLNLSHSCPTCCIFSACHTGFVKQVTYLQDKLPGNNMLLGKIMGCVTLKVHFRVSLGQQRVIDGADVMYIKN